MQATHALCTPYIFSFFLLLDLSYPITEYHMDIICLCNKMQRQRVHAGNSCTVHALHFFLFLLLDLSYPITEYHMHMFMQYAEAKGPCRQLMHCACLTFFLFLLLDLSYPITEYHMDIICLCNINAEAKGPCRQLMHCACLTFFLSFFCWTYHIPEYHMDIICLCNIMQRQRVHAGNSCTVHALHFFLFLLLDLSYPITEYHIYHMFMQ